MKSHTAFMRVSEDEALLGKKDWKLNTESGMEEAIREGMPYHSLYTYSSHQKSDKKARFIYGDLWIVTLDLKNRFDALDSVVI